MNRLAQLDHRYLWHPFTQMGDWLKTEPVVLVKGRGSLLYDAHGHEYLDANASIWTNLHGHAHPRINASIRAQLQKVAHTSALGFANEPASLLGEQLVQAANPHGHRPRLSRVFYSDNGSTAIEVALKLAYETARRTRNLARPRFLSLEGAYHGDTVGAVALGHIDLFHKAFSGLLFKTDQVPAPYCYRCPHNKAKPERADARTYRSCKEECVSAVEKTLARRKGPGYAGFVFEPLMQGSAGMIAQPEGWLAKVTALARVSGAALIADEVMTGFGRTGVPQPRPGKDPAQVLFACQQEEVQPDYMALAKGMSGGYLPMAATLTTEAVFKAFLGRYDEYKSFFHGHSFTGNQLGSAAALASLDILRSRECLAQRGRIQSALRAGLAEFWNLPCVGDIRQVGLVAGIELVRDWRTREPFAMSERVGIRVCEAMARRGVLTRPIGSVLVIMPPYSTTVAQVRRITTVMSEAIAEVTAPTSRTRKA